MSAPKSRTLRPSRESFQNSGWLPKSEKAFHDYMNKLSKKIEKQRKLIRAGDAALLPSVQKFKDFIESEPTVYGEFIRMFEDADDTDPPSSYEDLILQIDDTFRHAPAFGALGPPMYMIMARIMDTQGGFSAFTKENLNRHFKEMFVAWTLFLASKDSRDVLNAGDDGWLSTAAMDAMTEQFPGRTFEDVFICDSGAEYYGFTSYEDFFNRRFGHPEIDRPTINLDDSTVSFATECTSYAYQENVQKYDELFIKDEAYSLQHLLAGHHVDDFVGGTVLQGFLNTTGYHRWHAPVNGIIKQIVDIPGTYFAQAPSTIGKPIEGTEAPPYLQSLRFFANTAARQLMFIDADDEQIGLMCVVSIGMTEISTCQATVSEGHHVVRGDELGMFHFGGSSSALVFRASSGVNIDKELKVPEVALKINFPLNLGLSSSPIVPPGLVGRV
ncbi:Phophatidylserine decarboxylase-domain-containing protein [Annulohypoxylon maeteangense]|uniref:Phophatidylserine decarboxylase-domain-containing protein n=1 Tax=Annulohypoxylon maeteangense TaxID=1927788 RepID=UPI00200804BB|nr:Phophatidylserine decarboxylase-domain-containing protein [Annulohypoxylon maeteangense]KAI0881813.1 Phophatidylserine decarboxylase-domain-containing protein [Annulohypoxylon maeteangense]